MGSHASRTSAAAGVAPAGPAVGVAPTRAAANRMHPVPLGRVRLGAGFWSGPRDRARDGLAGQHRLLESTGRLANLRRAATPDGAGEFVGHRFNDSDVYKWLEAAAWSLAERDEPHLRALVDDTVELIAAAQQQDGYLNSYVLFEHAGERWQDMDHSHQLYSAGHLFQAAVAHRRAGLGDRLLDVARAFADLICETFGPAAEGKLEATDGHPEIEMALVELFRETGERRYLDQARFFVEARRGLGRINGSPHPQLPFREYDRMAAHAVCHGYLNAGVTDLAAEIGDRTLVAALERQWEAAVSQQLYLTGAVGARHDGEAFGAPYELPNERAYAETCAAIAFCMWSWRMLLLTGEARYADAMETTLHNAFLSGFSLSGDAYFYVNPLADDGNHRRTPWFDVACCPPNIARTLATLPGYVAATSQDTVWLHLYAAGEIEADLADGPLVRLTTATRYPWDGRVEVTVETDGEFAVALRIPGWCGNAVPVSVSAPASGEFGPVEDGEPGTYATVRRRWRAGDVITLDLPVRPRFVESHPHALENTGRVALCRGPLVYCLEGVDNPGYDLRDLAVDPDGAVAMLHDPELLGGVAVARFPARVEPPGAAWDGRLYRPYTRTESGREPSEPVTATAVPYYAWANRDSGPMQIWLRMR